MMVLPETKTAQDFFKQKYHTNIQALDRKTPISLKMDRQSSRTPEEVIMCKACFWSGKTSRASHITRTYRVDVSFRCSEFIHLTRSMCRSLIED